MKYLIVLGLLLAACGQDTSSFPVAGPAGADGKDGTVITPVELCPGFVATYPSKFPEYALCISDQLYGVYSDHGGFLALLPPGDYYSNGINASCNLRIAAHCAVTKL